MKLRFLIAFMLIGSIDARPADRSPIAITTRQCIVVISDSWTSSSGTAHCFDREENSEWQRRGKPIPVLLGRTGMAWGRGETDHREFSGPVKREGDDKAPAGVFRLGTAFGYAKQPVPTRMPYLPLSKNVVAVDDSRSRYYNQLVNRSTIREIDWRSAENMILADGRYKWGVFVRHNDPPVAGAGSCIFLHVWKNPSTLTSGCTAMPEPAMIRLLKWLKPEKQPLLIQLPRSIYNELRPGWALPAL